MTTVRKQVELEPVQDAKLRRLSEASGRPEADLIREAIVAFLEAAPEPEPPVILALRAAGLSVERLPSPLGPSEARTALEHYETWAREHGPIGLSHAVLDERQTAL